MKELAQAHFTSVAAAQGHRRFAYEVRAELDQDVLLRGDNVCAGCEELICSCKCDIEMIVESSWRQLGLEEKKEYTRWVLDFVPHNTTAIRAPDPRAALLAIAHFRAEVQSHVEACPPVTM